jgi:hypothetical protein
MQNEKREKKKIREKANPTEELHPTPPWHQLDRRAHN